MAHNHFIRNTKHATTYSLDSDMNLRSSVTSSLDAPAIDPIQVEVWRHLFASIAEEMGATLDRTGFSTNIKERLDHSCALFDSAGRLLAQAAHIPVHLGAMPLMMERLQDSVEWTPGVMWLCNDPNHGGTHLPDFTLVAPVYELRKTRNGKRSLGPLIGFVANRAHHADIGGLAPGSLSMSSELFHEGMIIPPVKLVNRGKIQSDVLALICANSRSPNERKGDLAAQVAANQTGIRRMQELVTRYGRTEFETRAWESRIYSERAVSRILESAPAGQYEYEDVLDDDGFGNTDLRIRVKATIQGGGIRFDFTGTAPETLGSVNATEAVTRSACYYVVRCLLDEEIPMNSGALVPVEVIAPEGTLVNARFPRAVAAGNVETSQRITDVVLGALQPAFPDRIPAASQGTMNNVLIGGFDPIRNRGYAYYETLCGGAGASPDSRGASAVHTHMTNTRNTPIEALEMHYPLRVRRYAIREESGGSGAHRGGDGVVREIELLAESQVSVVSDRRTHAPPGIRAESGKPGRNQLKEPNGDTAEIPGKWSSFRAAGTVVIVETPGGGGWNRSHEAAAEDDSGRR